LNPGSKKSTGPLVHLLGLVGVLCVGIAIAGLWGAFAPAAKAPVARVAPRTPVVAAAASQAQPAGEDRAHVAETGVVRGAGASPYPLEVGRYWVYVSEDAERGTRTEVERRIVRRESRPDQELFYFSDGTVAFRQDDKIFEMGPEGGVNVIPTGADPYIYRSQGLHIEKQVGTTDTVMIFGGQRYAHCVQVITRFRPIDQPDRDLRAYASYYARGIGLVARELWPPAADGAPSHVLTDYGPQKL